VDDAGDHSSGQPPQASANRRESPAIRGYRRDFRH
jgi:hypothetical protein